MLSTILKEQTLDAHRALEKILIPHLKAIKTTEDYVKILQRFYRFYAPLETQILKNLPSDLIADYLLRRKSECLANDIQSLTVEVYSPISLTNSAVSINSVAEALGAMYVLEGSTLGGNIISKLIMKSLTMSDVASLTFFTGYGSETMAMWEKFKMILNSYPLDNAQRSMVVYSANQTFIKFKQSFN